MGYVFVVLGVFLCVDIVTFTAGIVVVVVSIS